MNTDYYAEIEHESDPARRVGWRHRIEQAYRFELALEVVRATAAQIVDVGCGVGGFAEYLRDNGLVRDWVGIERNPRFAAEASRYGPVLTSSFEDVEPSALGEEGEGRCVVAIGTLAGGRPARQVLPALCAFAARFRGPFCLVALDAARLGARPALSLEHAPSALHAAELLDRAAREFTSAAVVSISTTDLALVAGVSPAALRTNAERFDATVAGVWGDEEPAERKAWLALEVGLPDRAEAWLGQGRVPSALGDLVRERLRSAAPSGG